MEADRLGWIFSLGIFFLGVSAALLGRWVEEGGPPGDAMAGIFGPVLINYIRQHNVTHGVAKAQAYNVTMHVMAVLLVIGLAGNALVRAVNARHHMGATEPDVAPALEAGRS